MELCAIRDNITCDIASITDIIAMNMIEDILINNSYM